MPSVNSVVGQANMVAGLSTKLFGTNFAAAKNSLLIQPANNTFANFLKSDFGGQPALTNLIENYSNKRENFQETLKENMSSLKESADKVKGTSETETETPKVADTDNDKNTGAALSTLGEFANGNIPPQERNIALTVKPKTNPKPETPEPKDNLQKFANEYLTAEKSVEKTTTSNEDSRVTNVKNLVRDFNSAMSYLNENRGMSNRMAALADHFGSSKLNDSLNEIGISVNSQGFLSLNESAFNSALSKNSESVNSILGSEGLAGQLDKNINLANYQGDKLFTSITDFANHSRQDDAESLYGSRANYAQENTPRIFAMLT
jgi:hypothetical protein